MGSNSCTHGFGFQRARGVAVSDQWLPCAQGAALQLKMQWPFRPLSRHTSMSVSDFSLLYISPPPPSTFPHLHLSLSLRFFYVLVFLRLKIDNDDDHASQIRWSEHEREVSGNSLCSPERACFSLHWVCFSLSLPLHTHSCFQNPNCRFSELYADTVV